ncbi:MAG: GatB/YqeY domain-containing protein [Candidatus Shapirobacteria bacterium]
MLLRDKLKTEADKALKNHDQEMVDILRYLISLIDKRALQLPADEFNEVEETKVLQKELKNKQEAKKLFEDAGRIELAAAEAKEIAVLESYLPKALDQDELEVMIDRAMADGDRDFGAIMRKVIAESLGRASGGQVSELVKKKLSGN